MPRTMKTMILILILLVPGPVVWAQHPRTRLPVTDHKTVVIARRGDHENVLNNEEQYKAWKQVAPGLPLMASLPGSMDLGQLDSLLDKKEISVVDNAYREERIEFLHARGIAVWSDVESEGEGPAVWQKMLDSGADGLQTDHPRELIGYLTESNRR